MLALRDYTATGGELLWDLDTRKPLTTSMALEMMDFESLRRCPLAAGRKKTPRTNPQVEDVLEIDAQWL
jgi:hypothetical protein